MFCGSMNGPVVYLFAYLPGSFEGSTKTALLGNVSAGSNFNGGKAFSVFADIKTPNMYYDESIYKI